ncbi:interleukin-18 receptor 1-like [Scleropages formosus]|uniref:Interleukin-18 receptor 1-like n=1 Tax=Scleropages formosus TaxID=113540 RepID=A0A8C9RGL0_SCLFO|nr:interleukin-18 receptor 1-like [Scleropages formosus]
MAMKIKYLVQIIFLIKEMVCLTAAAGGHAGVKHPVYAREGEVAALRCPLPNTSNKSSVIWNVNTTQGLQELREESGSLLKQYNGTLLMLKVMKNDSGMYCCSKRNGKGAVMQSWTNLTVLSDTCFREAVADVYIGSCLKGQSCSFRSKSPDDIPLSKINITWFKDCQTKVFSLEKVIYFESVTENDAANYTCKHYFEYEGQVYYKSTTTRLIVIDYKFPLQPKMIKPQPNEVIEVDVGKPAAIQCSVLLNSNTSDDFLELFWIDGSTIVSENQTLSVFYNSTFEEIEKNYYMISWLIFKNVSKNHLNATYTCKLETTLPRRISASITLKEKVHPARVRSILLSLGLVGICVISVAVVTVICYKMKIYIVLFFRDLWEVPSSSADGKQYDAYISYYNTCSEEALSEEEITLLLDTMETKYGFQLCVYHRDVLPGGAMVDAVLEHVKQSRRLILVPREQGPQAEDQYGLWNGLHAALVDRYTWLVFIQKAPCNSLDSLPEPLCMLAHSGDAITWKGSRSAHHSSAFWKHLLYHMPPRRKHQEERLTLL